MIRVSLLLYSFRTYTCRRTYWQEMVQFRFPPWKPIFWCFFQNGGFWIENKNWPYFARMYVYMSHVCKTKMRVIAYLVFLKIAVYHTHQIPCTLDITHAHRYAYMYIKPSIISQHTQLHTHTHVAHLSSLQQCRHTHHHVWCAHNVFVSNVGHKRTISDIIQPTLYVQCIQHIHTYT